MRRIWRLLAALLGLSVSAAVARRWRRGRRRRTSVVDARRLTGVMLPPERLVQRIPLEPGMRVLILGPTDLRWIRLVTQLAGRYGKVYVAESTAERARALDTIMRREGVFGVEALALRGPRLDLPDSSVDLVLGVGVLAGRPARERLLWELGRVLRPGGHVSLSEGLCAPRYLSASRLRGEAQAMGLLSGERHGTPLAYTVNFRKAG